MNATVAEWLASVVDDPVEVNPADGGQEARDNMRLFSASQEEASAMTIGDIERFIAVVVRARSEVLSRQRIRPGSMVFYCWFDVMAAQLRYGTVSVTDGSLPFRCRVVAVDLRTVAAAFLGSQYHNGIPWEELRPVEGFVEPSETPSKAWTLGVWSVPIP